jgi:hypothetical protein
MSIPTYQHRSSHLAQPRVEATEGTIAALRDRATSKSPRFIEPSQAQYAKARARGLRAPG